MVFNVSSYKEKMNIFPDIEFNEYDQITDLSVRKDIAKKNKIISTDSYNRTMTYLKGDLGKKIETYGLFLRRSPNEKFNVIYGVKAIVEKILAISITQTELDFAADYYSNQTEKGGNGHFDKAMWQKVIDENNGFLPLTVRAVKDGTVLKPKEPMMTITGPGELAAIFEPLFLRAFFQSVVATDAAYIEQIIGSGRVAEFGKRAAFNEEGHLDAVEANIVGMGLNNTSNDVAGLVFPQVVTGGTTAHRYFAAYSTEDEAFVNAIEKSEKIALLVDLIDSYKGIDKIIKLKQEYRNKGTAIGMRLDSGNLAEQAAYALKEQVKTGMMDPTRDKIIVADISTIDDIRIAEEACAEALEGTGFDYKDYIIYGLGGLIVARNKTRDAVSGGFKLINTEAGATGKLSDNPGKSPIPGIPNIEIRDGKRYIVQEDENVQGLRMLTKVYDNGEMFFEENNDIKAIDNARKTMKETMKYIDYPQVDSEATKKVKEDVARKFGQII